MDRGTVQTTKIHMLGKKEKKKKKQTNTEKCNIKIQDMSSLTNVFHQK